MIRPVTLVCWVLALCAGLYLYRAKHEVELMDQHIDQIAKQTADLRVESRGLLDEWIRLGEPEQLHRYSDEYLGLQPISPGQFARLSDLPARLPPTQPDPSDEQAEVVAQSSGGTAIGVALPDNTRSPADQAGAPHVDPAETVAVNPDQSEAVGADNIPVPPIPPAVIPVAITGISATPGLPLQARPVTPRMADGQPDPENARPRPGTPSPGTDEPRPGTTRVTSTLPADPHQGLPGPINSQALHLPGGQTTGAPPLQAQEGRDAPGLPPLQSQALAREIAQGSGRVPAQVQGLARASGQMPLPRPQEPRTAENRLNEPPREARPVELQQPRDPSAPYGHRGQPDAEPAQMGQSQMSAVQGGSLLGMSRGPVPLPLPTPTPVNANWSGPGSPGSGR